MSSLLAGLGGVLIAYQRELVSATSFGIFESIVALAFAYLAGLGAPVAALVAGVLAAGGVLTEALDSIGGGGSERQLAISGLVLVVAAIRWRGGLLGGPRRSPVVEHGS